MPSAVNEPARPADIGPAPETNIERFLRDVIVRTNFVPAVRHFIGWRGIKDASGLQEGWTARIENYPGVFAIGSRKATAVSPDMGGIFQLYYFPDRDEALLEQFSLMANYLAHREDYLARVRTFTQHPDFAEQFLIGQLNLTLAENRAGARIRLEALARKCTRVEAGVSLMQDGRRQQLIEPGGCDENIPAFELAAAFTEVLGASLAFHLQLEPTRLRHDRRAGRGIVVAENGTRREQAFPQLFLETLQVDFGEPGDRDEGEESRRPAADSETVAAWRPGRDRPKRWAQAPWWEATRIPLQQTMDKTFLGIDDRPPLLILSGFLGSGKTSFLGHFIEYQASRQRFVAVIQNEIGAKGLDGKLVEDNFTVAEMDEGCVCCTLAGNLKKAIQSILNQFRPDYVVLETTGLANPFNLLDDMQELQEMVRFDSVTTVIDAANFEQALQESQVAAEQVRAADIILLNKTDRVSAETLKALQDRLSDFNAKAPIIPCRHGDIQPGMLYGIDPLENTPAQSAAPAPILKKFSSHSHLHDGITSHMVALKRPLVRSRFIDFVESGRLQTLLRAKGLVQFAGEDAPQVFQYVRGQYEISDLSEESPQERFIVFIGKHIEPEPLEAGIQSALALPV